MEQWDDKASALFLVRCVVCGDHRHNAIVTKLGHANHVILPSHGHLVSVLSLTPAPIVFSSFVGNYIYEVTRLAVSGVACRTKWY